MTAVATTRASPPGPGRLPVGQTRSPDYRARPGFRVLREMLAVLIPVVLAVNPTYDGRITWSMILVAATAPVWLPGLFRVQYGPLFVAVSALYLAGGFWVASISRVDHEIAQRAALGLALTYATYLGGVGAMVWAYRVIGVQWVLVLYAGAVMGSELMNRGGWPGNYIKFIVIYPLELFVLAMLTSVASTTVRIGVVGALALFCVANDYRSGFAMLMVAAGILAWQRLRLKDVRQPSIVAFILGLVTAGFLVYFTVTSLLVSGALGEELKARSEAQVASSGSLLLGGRPEWSVTIRLFLDRPLGFGFGAVPAPRDVDLGRQGFASIHLLSQEGYLRNYIFGDGFRLHSITADLWSTGGPAGLLLAAVLIWILVATLATDLARRVATPAQVFLTLLALWNLGFSPSYTNFPQVVLMLGMALAVRRAPPEPAASPGPLPSGTRHRARNITRRAHLRTLR